MESFHQDSVLHFVKAAAGAFRVRDWALNRVDPDGLRYAGTVAIWARWCVTAMCLSLLFYRPEYAPGRFAAYVVLCLLLVAINVSVHYLLFSKRMVTWLCIFALCVMDLVLVSLCVVVGGGFDHYFFYLLYYPVLAGFAVFFTSFRLNMVLVTLVALVYLVINLTAGDGIDFGARDEKPLFVRIVVMYVVVAMVNLVSRFERIRWWAAAERERSLQRERSQLSKTIHDTTAQSAYMIGLGIDAVKRIAVNYDNELMARLEAISFLSKTVVWELRHPIDLGRILEGRGLSRTLESHVATFTTITSVSADVVQSGFEPSLSVEAKSRLFSIAHNALTNAFRHSEASRVLVEFDFRQDDLILTVSDDGIGLPEDYAERGHGFANMRQDTERLGGRLIVEQRGAVGGAAVTCVIPLNCNLEGA